ncbi:MAG: hypothetical protein M3456_04810 [Actinomycetota bacterium]|nr:hypothetical protein [Actinomycetota bacterium]
MTAGPPIENTLGKGDPPGYPSAGAALARGGGRGEVLDDSDDALVVEGVGDEGVAQRVRRQLCLEASLPGDAGDDLRAVMAVDPSPALVTKSGPTGRAANN